MSMTSWASIAKRNTSSAALASTGATGATVPASYDYQKWFQRETAQKKESLTLLEKEEQEQCRPTWFSLRRPNAPTTFPVFKTREEMHAWDMTELRENQKYSDEVFERRTQEWRIKNNWLLPPMKTTVSQDETRKGFYLHLSKQDGKPVVSYNTPYSTEEDLNNEQLVDMMWCLVHSRSDELVACKTVADFKALFESIVHLEPDVRRAHLYSRRKDTYPIKMLWLFSQKANVFPGKARPGTARWTNDPVCAPRVDKKLYTKSMVFFTSRVFRDATTNAITIGQHGGRDETGICVVERLKENGDAANIRWLLSAKQLHEMERVVFCPEYCPFHNEHSFDDFW